jgi:hypothetical protein
MIVDSLDAALLETVAAGRLAGQENLLPDLRRLSAEGLVCWDSDGHARLTPHGRLQVQVAHGECAAPPLG